jgi:hypothetical protein
METQVRLLRHGRPHAWHRFTLANRARAERLVCDHEVASGYAFQLRVHHSTVGWMELHPVRRDAPLPISRPPEIFRNPQDDAPPLTIISEGT